MVQYGIRRILELWRLLTINDNCFNTMSKKDKTKKPIIDWWSLLPLFLAKLLFLSKTLTDNSHSLIFAFILQGSQKVHNRRNQLLEHRSDRTDLCHFWSDQSNWSDGPGSSRCMPLRFWTEQTIFIRDSIQSIWLVRLVRLVPCTCLNSTEIMVCSYHFLAPCLASSNRYLIAQSICF